MKNLEKLSLKGALGVLSEKELKNVFGGSGSIDTSGYCYKYRCSGSSETDTCRDNFTSCQAIFSDRCPTGGDFEPC